MTMPAHLLEKRPATKKDIRNIVSDQSSTSVDIPMACVSKRRTG
jgi:hypothetical protein